MKSGRRNFSLPKMDNLTSPNLGKYGPKHPNGMGLIIAVIPWNPLVPELLYRRIIMQWAFLIFSRRLLSSHLLSPPPASFFPSPSPFRSAHYILFGGRGEGGLRGILESFIIAPSVCVVFSSPEADAAQKPSRIRHYNGISRNGRTMRMKRRIKKGTMPKKAPKLLHAHPFSAKKSSTSNDPDPKLRDFESVSFVFAPFVLSFSPFSSFLTASFYFPPFNAP